VSPIIGQEGRVERIVSISREVTDQRHASEQLEILNAELHHRIKNNLATVQALSRATLRGSPDPKTFEKSFSGRLEALGKTYDLLRTGPEAATIRDLVEAELRPFGGESDRLTIDGPEVLLSSSAAVAVGMILHELTTNASKYGALAHPDGQLAVSWRDEVGRVALRWSESMPPTTSIHTRGGGFGSVLIDRLTRQLGGKVERRWEPQGLTLELLIPDPRSR
jgi:two-component sensor histidine kinase